MILLHKLFNQKMNIFSEKFILFSITTNNTIKNETDISFNDISNVIFLRKNLSLL